MRDCVWCCELVWKSAIKERSIFQCSYSCYREIGVSTSMWNAVELDHVDVENDIGINVSSMPSPGLRRIRVGGLASHLV